MTTPSEIKIIVPGKPNARKAHKIGLVNNPKTGKPVRKPLLNDEDAAWQNLVKMAAQQAMHGAPPLAGHVWAHYLFIFPAPMSALRKAEKLLIMSGKTLLAQTRSDICNLIKNANDGLKNVAVQDDRLIRSGGFDIRVGLKPCAIITLRPIGEQDR
ncbi:RusA family crossover junction endodeoxyribonuclease [bacterium]|nr:RusA family crossover junction endodeoxyribonuclease [bacterium]